MAASSPNLPLKDPVDVLERLKGAVDTLARGSGSYQERMDRATSVLVEIPPEQFRRLPNRVTYVLSTRHRVSGTYESGQPYWAFSRLTPKQRQMFTEDLLALFEACVLDVRELYGDSLYPKDRSAADETPHEG
jgi:hypothetical protein